MKQLNLEPIFTSINLFKFDKFYEKCVRKIARIQSGQGDKPKSENKYRKLKI